jgi:hypothetical protein
MRMASTTADEAFREAAAAVSTASSTVLVRLAFCPPVLALTSTTAMAPPALTALENALLWSSIAGLRLRIINAATTLLSAAGSAAESQPAAAGRTAAEGLPTRASGSS